MICVRRQTLKTSNWTRYNIYNHSLIIWMTICWNMKFIFNNERSMQGRGRKDTCRKGNWHQTEQSFVDRHPFVLFLLAIVSSVLLRFWLPLWYLQTLLYAHMLILEQLHEDDMATENNYLKMTWRHKRNLIRCYCII